MSSWNSCRVWHTILSATSISACSTCISACSTCISACSTCISACSTYKPWMSHSPEQSNLRGEPPLGARFCMRQRGLPTPQRDV